MAALDSPLMNVIADVNDVDNNVAETTPADDDSEPPYSPSYEVKYFFSKGIPLGLSSILEWGFPPWFSMIMAGHTPTSAALQSALGYGRVFYNCTLLMVICGMISYYNNVLPGCIGADRKERIPMYLKRSIIVCFLCLLPFMALQLFAAPIMNTMGVPADISVEVGVYCRIMAIVGWLLCVEAHLEITFINLGYASCATLNSLVTGLGVDVVCTYFFVYKWNMGMYGAALVQLSVKSARILVWLVLMVALGLTQTIMVDKTKERIFDKKELSVFFSLSLPSIASMFSGWFIFELQLMAMSNIPGISEEALAAGAIWVQSESVLASIQNGWTTVTSLRSLVLLGKQDPGAPRAYAILCVLGALLVGLSNIPLLIWSEQVSRAVSNDPEVQRWFEGTIWMLVLHSQTRITTINATCLFIPLGKPMVRIGLQFLFFYLVGSPVAAVVALTDWVTQSIHYKLLACMSVSPIAQIFLSLFGFTFLCRLDWTLAGKIVNDRANTDKDTPDSKPAIARSDHSLATPSRGQGATDRLIGQGGDGSSGRYPDPYDSNHADHPDSNAILVAIPVASSLNSPLIGPASLNSPLIGPTSLNSPLIGRQLSGSSSGSHLHNHSSVVSTSPLTVPPRRRQLSA